MKQLNPNEAALKVLYCAKVLSDWGAKRVQSNKATLDHVFAPLVGVAACAAAAICFAAVMGAYSAMMTTTHSNN